LPTPQPQGIEEELIPPHKVPRLSSTSSGSSYKSSEREEESSPFMARKSLKNVTDLELDNTNGTFVVNDTPSKDSNNSVVTFQQRESELKRREEVTRAVVTLALRLLNKMQMQPYFNNFM
jgi:hypothetical protein